MVYQISYDFVGNWTDSAWYCRVDNAIKAYGTWMHFQRSEWFIESQESAAQIHANLWQYMRPYDRLMVIRVYDEWCVAGLNQQQLDWLRARNFGSLVEALASFFAPRVLPTPLPAPNPFTLLAGLSPRT